jgi:zinc protease
MKRRKLIAACFSVTASFVWLSGSTCVAQESKASSEKTKALGSDLPSLSVTEYKLKNGLSVMLSRDSSLPSVAAHIVYLVGSGHEEKGRTGFAHLFEHLMFQGSAHYDDEYFTPFEPIGARTNGTTSSDRTVYYEEVPSHYMELALWMESDRMRSLLPVLTQEKLDNQREVVKNERRQRYEVTPYGMSWWHMDHALYPVGHPYHHATIGSHEDLTAATLEDVRAFFLKYYVPKNAALSLVGDFDETEARNLIEKYFGDIAPGQRAPTPSAKRPVITAPKHWVVEDEVALPRVYFAWITPALFESGDAELDLLSNVLSEGKSSRLFHSLVYERKLAKDIHAFQISQQLNGVYVIQATAAPGTTIDVLAAAVQEELKKALDKPPTESELRRAKNSYKKEFFDRLQTYSSRASLLGTYFLHTGKGDYVREDYNRYVQATGGSVQKAGQTYLTENSYVRLDFIPGKKNSPVRKMGEDPPKMAPTTQKGAAPR